MVIDHLIMYKSGTRRGTFLQGELKVNFLITILEVKLQFSNLNQEEIVKNKDLTI